MAKEWIALMPYKNAAKRRAFHRRCKNTAYANNPQKYKIRVQQYRTENWERVLIANARRRAEKKGLPFDLDKHSMELEQRLRAKVCELSGLPLDRSKHNGPYFPSLDRIIPSLGYVYSNIRVICFALNTAFGSWGEAETLKIFQAISNRTHDRI